ncbi:MAG: hypothetical protein R3B47_10790 [Bacteroidia bacterium]
MPYNKLDKEQLGKAYQKLEELYASTHPGAGGSVSKCPGLTFYAMSNRAGPGITALQATNKLGHRSGGDCDYEYWFYVGRGYPIIDSDVWWIDAALASYGWAIKSRLTNGNSMTRIILGSRVGSPSYARAHLFVQ